MKKFVYKSAFFLILLSLTCSISSFADCSNERKIVFSEEEINWAAGFKKTTWTVRQGCDPLNRFQFHRVMSNSIEETSTKGRIFLSPGEGWGFQNFESTPERFADGSLNRAKSMAGKLAAAGYAVYGFTPKSVLIPGKCERCFPFLKACPKGARYDCSAMKTWTFENHVDDAQFAIDEMRKIPPFTNPVVGGLSLGAFVSIALVNRSPDQFEGLFVWEGMLTSKNTKVISNNLKLCEKYTRSLENGHFIETQSMGVFKKLFSRFKHKPNGWSPFGKLIGLPLLSSNADVFYYAMTMDQPDPVEERYVFAMGDWRRHHFDFASIDIIEQTLATVAFYLPISTMRDYTCALAGKTDYVSRLPQFKKPVLAISHEFGFGRAMEDNLSLFSKDQTTYIFYPKMGHGDAAFSAKRSEYIDQPLLGWLGKSLN